ncbi:hypothetical protein MSIMFI_04997 [Mycobacterium simulans]|nr:hypothetical protein MSIMFI_04997 [Mycobacterium simulans]
MAHDLLFTEHETAYGVTVPVVFCQDSVFE